MELLTIEFWLIVYLIIVIASWIIDDIWTSLNSPWHKRFEAFKRKFRGYL
jgi:hypothetical protein